MGSGMARKYGNILDGIFNEIKDLGGWAEDSISTVAVYLGKELAEVNVTPACIIMPGTARTKMVALRRKEHDAPFLLHVCVDDQNIQNGLLRVIDRAEDVYDKLERNTLGTVLGGSEYLTVESYTPQLGPYESLMRHWTTIEIRVRFTTETKN